MSNTHTIQFMFFSILVKLPLNYLLSHASMKAIWVKNQNVIGAKLLINKFILTSGSKLYALCITEVTHNALSSVTWSDGWCTTLVHSELSVEIETDLHLSVTGTEAV